MTALAALIGVLFGAIGAWLFIRPRIQALAGRANHLDAALEAVSAERDQNIRLVRELEPEVATLRERVAVLGEIRTQVEERLKIVATEVLTKSTAALSDSTKQILEPLRLSVERVDRRAQELEQARRQAHGALARELELLAQGQERLRSETSNLVGALRTPHVRGRWGEVQLKRVIEYAGMVPYCDFVEQATTSDSEGNVLRPDVVVNLPGGKHVVIDSKTPLDAYLDWLEAADDGARAARLADHARQVRDHVSKLAAKRYWRQFQPAPDFVVMFVPDEAFLRAAQEHDSTIQEKAWESNVIPASPTNLIVLLRTIAAIWQQETAAEDVRRISELGKELYERLGTMGKHFARVGRSLDGAVAAYNETVGSLETRVLVTARKLDAEPADAIPSLAPVEKQSRPLQALELAVDNSDLLELPAAPADAA
jgi:DNA recombination protein RmuC